MKAPRLGYSRINFTSLKLAALAATATLLAPVSHAALLPGYVTIDGVHTDIAMPLIRSGVNDPGVWDPHIHTGSYSSAGWNNYAPNEAVLMVNETTRVTLPDWSGFSFIGAPAGSDVYMLDWTQVPGQLYLGVEVQRASTPSSGASPDPIPTPVLPNTPENWGSWDPDGAGPAGNNRGFAISLLNVRFNPDGNATSATQDAASQGVYFSTWQYSPFGESIVAMATSDGIDASDAFLETIGSHSHYNWAFTQAGFYEIDLQARTFLGSAGDSAGLERLSDIVTFHFRVGETTPVPLPASVLLLASGLIALLRRRQPAEAPLPACA